MLYIDLLLSFILFVMGLLSLTLKKYTKNVWIILLSLLFFPVSIITSYFPEINVTLFGDITLTHILLFPGVKILILLSFFFFMDETRNRNI